jgi:hypothetical protein
LENDAKSKAEEAAAAVAKAKEEGILDDKPALQREDFLTDEEILREMFDPPVPPS